MVPAVMTEALRPAMFEQVNVFVSEDQVRVCVASQAALANCAAPAAVFKFSTLKFVHLRPEVSAASGTRTCPSFPTGSRTCADPSRVSKSPLVVRGEVSFPLNVFQSALEIAPVVVVFAVAIEITGVVVPVATEIGSVPVTSVTVPPLEVTVVHEVTPLPLVVRTCPLSPSFTGNVMVQEPAAVAG